MRMLVLRAKAHVLGVADYSRVVCGTALVKPFPF